jgi:hypothetical protein
MFAVKVKLDDETDGTGSDSVAASTASSRGAYNA